MYKIAQCASRGRGVVNGRFHTDFEEFYKYFKIGIAIIAQLC